ncbi:MAG: pantetheine-phosphate adenylyltransferase [bacterium]
MTLAIYPGSFDPLTKGHLDVLKRASKIFEKVIIAVLNNQAKEPFIPLEDKLKLIQDAIIDAGLTNVEVDCFDGLTVEYAKKKNAKVLIRGLRAVSDFEYEMQLAQMNQNLDPTIETVFLTTKPNYNFISPQVVKEAAKLGGDISKLVPKNVNDYFNKRCRV